MSSFEERSTEVKTVVEAEENSNLESETKTEIQITPDKQSATDHPEDEVHSANSWETADLGDKSRNDKFMRLLGAKKKEHHGRFVIGDQESKHSRPKGEERHMVEELEDQFKQSIEHRLVGGRKGHIGLGFHEDDQKVLDEENGQGTEKKEEVEERINDNGDKEKTSASDDGKSTLEKEDKGGDRKRESDDKKSECEHSDSKKIKFVASSS